MLLEGPIQHVVIAAQRAVQRFLARLGTGGCGAAYHLERMRLQSFFGAVCFLDHLIAVQANQIILTDHLVPLRAAQGLINRLVVQRFPGFMGVGVLR